MTNRAEMRKNPWLTNKQNPLRSCLLWALLSLSRTENLDVYFWLTFVIGLLVSRGSAAIFAVSLDLVQWQQLYHQYKHRVVFCGDAVLLFWYWAAILEMFRYYCSTEATVCMAFRTCLWMMGGECAVRKHANPTIWSWLFTQPLYVSEQIKVMQRKRRECIEIHDAVTHFTSARNLENGSRVTSTNSKIGRQQGENTWIPPSSRGLFYNLCTSTNKSK